MELLKKNREKNGHLPVLFHLKTVTFAKKDFTRNVAIWFIRKKENLKIHFKRKIKNVTKQSTYKNTNILQ